MDYDEVHLHVTYANDFDMDAAFCASMRIAIAAGLENAPTGVITMPGTKKPKCVRTEYRPLAHRRAQWTFSFDRSCKLVPKKQPRSYAAAGRRRH